MCDVRGSLVEWLPPGDNTVPWKICKNPAKTKNRRNTLSSEDWVMSQIEKLQIVPGEEEVNDSNVAIDEDGFGWGDDLMCDEDDNQDVLRDESPRDRPDPRKEETEDEDGPPKMKTNVSYPSLVLVTRPYTSQMAEHRRSR